MVDMVTQGQILDGRELKELFPFLLKPSGL